MDKDRREAERSGDPIRYALELRRSGEERRAKRLLQNLAWDNHDAMRVLEELYPVHPTKYLFVDDPNPLRRPISHVDDLLGTLDPRLNRRIEQRLIEMSNRPESDLSSQDPFRNWIRLVNERSLPQRVCTSANFLGRRLCYAEPLPEDLERIVAHAKILREQDERNSEARLGDLTLAWHIKQSGTPTLLQAWAEDYEPLYWLERRMVGDAIGAENFFQDERTKDPLWRFRDLPPYEVYDKNTLAVHGFYLEEGREHFMDLMKNPYLIVIYLNRQHEYGHGQRLERNSLRRAYVNVWQEVVGDRVIQLNSLEFLVLWEHGDINEIVQRLSEQRPDLQSLGLNMEHSVSLGAARLRGDWTRAEGRARERQIEAREEGLSFLSLNVV